MNKLVAFSVLIASLVLTARAQGGDSWSCPTYKYKVFLGNDGTSEGLEPYVTEFRTALGGESNVNNPGPLNSGFRSVNWDAPAVPFNMPFSFFRDTVTRGIFFKTWDDKFAVSNPTNAGVDDTRFSSFSPQFAEQFTTFSAPRLFAAVNSANITARFTVPATNTSATTAAFGAVLTNVDKAWLTTLAFYDKNNCLIHKANAQVAPQGLSFVGLAVYNDWDQGKRFAIDRVVLSLGDATISEPFNWEKNVVAVDDLLYSEPRAA